MAAIKDNTIINKSVYAAAEGANIRKGPGTNTQVLKTARQGELIGFATGYKEGTWINVGWPDDPKKLVPKPIYGWVSTSVSSFTQKKATGLNPAPSPSPSPLPSEQEVFNNIDGEKKNIGLKIVGILVAAGGLTYAGFKLLRPKKKKEEGNNKNQ